MLRMWLSGQSVRLRYGRDLKDETKVVTQDYSGENLMSLVGSAGSIPAIRNNYN